MQGIASLDSALMGVALTLAEHPSLIHFTLRVLRTWAPLLGNQSVLTLLLTNELCRFWMSCTS